MHDTAAVMNELFSKTFPPREKKMNSFVMKTSALEAIGMAVVALFLFRFFSRLASLLLSGYSFKPKKANWAVITG
jgi:hypothetical protein